MRRFALLCAAFAVAHAAAQTPDAAALYSEHCAACHSADRFGGTGPALLPENLERLKKGQAEQTVSGGRAATQMPAFAGKLDAASVKAVVDYIYAPPPVAPQWGESDIRASRIVQRAQETLPSRPSFSADPLNLFVVVEAGDHHVSVLDGDKFEPLARFASRYALHGGPKFSPDGRYVYFGSRDGWVTKYDLYALAVVAEVRAGLNMRNIAVSSDGKWVLAGNYLPHTLVVLDAGDLSLAKVISVAGSAGKSSRVSAVYDAAPRGSFIVALKDIAEAWEIPYAANAAPVYEGLVHDYRMGEALAAKGPFPVRRIQLDDILDDFFFDPGYDNLIGASREGRGQVVNLNVRRKIADIPLPGMPHLASGISWTRRGSTVIATTNLKEAAVSVIDTRTWQAVAQIATLGPGFFLRSHENSRYAFVDNFSSPDRDTLLAIDKDTLEVVARLRPAPGKTAAHVEFTRDGRYALASVWDDDGAIVVYDAATLKEVKRLPMKKPVGKYNVWNKITRSEGTSH